MSQASKQKRRGRYAEKKRLGLVPFFYDKNSKGFHQGAWKNWPREEVRNFDRDRAYAYETAMRP